MGYTPVTEEDFLIDKTDILERGLKEFLSVYLEGAAACGKTTAVKMLLHLHAEVNSFLFLPCGNLNKNCKK